MIFSPSRVTACLAVGGFLFASCKGPSLNHGRDTLRVATANPGLGNTDASLIQTSPAQIRLAQVKTCQDEMKDLQNSLARRFAILEQKQEMPIRAQLRKAEEFILAELSAGNSELSPELDSRVEQVLSFAKSCGMLCLARLRMEGFVQSGQQRFHKLAEQLNEVVVYALFLEVVNSDNEHSIANTAIFFLKGAPVSPDRLNQLSTHLKETWGGKIGGAKRLARLPGGLGS